MFRRFNAVFVVVALGAVVVLAAPTQLDIDPASTPVPIIAQSENNNADGTFNYSYEAGNGIKNQAEGFLKKIVVPVLNADGTPSGQEEEREFVVQTGSYSYPSPEDGEIITITYVADENGFQPTGKHIPTPPAIPDQILSSLQQQSSAAAAATSA